MAKVDFSRTVITATIRVAHVRVKDGKVVTEELAPITKVGSVKLDNDKAMKIAKTHYKDGTPLVVLEVSNKEEVRGMDFETFMKYSVTVERPESQQKDAKKDKKASK